MKTFDDNYNAWLQGQMTAAEAAAFERELEERPLSAEQVAALEADEDGLEEMLAASLGAQSAPKMHNEDFFNHQLLERIAEEDALAEGAGVKLQSAAADGASVGWQERLSGFLGIFALRPFATTVAAIALLLVTGLGLFWKPGQPTQSSTGHYYVQFDNVSTQDNNVWAGPVQKGEVTVLWTEGLDWIDGDESLLEEAGV